ncbi:MAG TPA: hypothetical protein VFV19_16200 [Candidatus Polarisedimenticolaceae bacterium]|nr:hypothetical protein [Candidatus Polarisedimenticolaceae bacterium]
MLRRFVVTYDYIETVRGEQRRFNHETLIEARDESDAHVRAVRYFGSSQLQSQVGWARQLVSCKVEPAEPGKPTRAGERVMWTPDPEV